MTSIQNRQHTVQLVQTAMNSGASQAKACQLLGLSTRTYQRWTSQGTVQADQRPHSPRKAPSNKLSDLERSQILQTCNDPAYASLPPSQIVPMLADKGEYIGSESSFYRILRQENQLQRRSKAQAPKRRSKPQAYQATKPNQVWSWDITYLPSTRQGQFYRLYLIMDIYSRKIVGWEIHENESSAHAATLIEKACWSERIHHQNLVLHSDNGSAMKGATMLAKLQQLGIIPSFSRPSVSNDNPYSESLFRTLKGTPAYPEKAFGDLNQARQWVKDFVHWYNSCHHHSALKFITPNDRHEGKEAQILSKRKVVYEQAKKAHPERWSGESRNWNPVGAVWLNPDKMDQSSALIISAVTA